MNFRELLKEKKVVFFDGAMGTSLQSYLSPGSPPEKLNLTLPQKVKEVHLSYAREGVDVIETNTFGANRVKLEKYGLASRTKDINYRAVKIAKEAASSQLVGASIGPLGDLIQPWGEITTSQALQVFREQIESIAEAGADLIVIETMASLKEARIAAVAAREVCDLPVVCQLTFGEQGKTLIGIDARTGVFALEALDLDVVGANCSIGPREMFPVVKTMVSCAKKPLIFQPNAGKPVLEKGKTLFPVTPEEFSWWTKKFVECGAKIIGGCCGTTSEHIAAMVTKTRNICVPSKKTPPIKGFSSRTKIYSFKEETPLLVGINLSREFIEGESLDKISELLAFAEEKQCSFLNLGFRKRSKGFGIGSFINFLQQNTNLGICIDTEGKSFLDEALGELEGKGLVFLNPDDEEALKITKKWGATVGFNIYLHKKTDIGGEFNRILEKCRQISVNPEEVVLKITMPPFGRYNFSFKDKITEIKKAKLCIPVSVILELNEFSRKAIGSNFLKGFLLGIASWYGIEGALLEPAQIESSLSILKAAEALSSKDIKGEKFAKFIGGKNASF